MAASTRPAARSRHGVPRRALIVSADIGAGHNSAGRALAEAMARAWPGCQVSWLDALAAIGPGFGPLARERGHVPALVLGVSKTAAGVAALRRYARSVLRRRRRRALPHRARWSRRRSAAGGCARPRVRS